MDVVLSGLLWQSCLAYIDDIIVIGWIFKNHFHNLDEVFWHLHLKDYWYIAYILTARIIASHIRHQLVVPPGLRQRVLAKSHDWVCGGTLLRTRHFRNWNCHTTGLDTESVVQNVRTCTLLQSQKPRHHFSVGTPMQIVAVDVLMLCFKLCSVCASCACV